MEQKHTTKINKKIVGHQVLTDSKVKDNFVEEQNLEYVHEGLARPDYLIGATYKIKQPGTDHAMYITINDMVLNKGTDHEQRVPYEIFINSKNMEHFQWVVALTRIISAIFRKGGELCFLVEELKSIFDPKGGYFKKGGVFVPSTVAEIAICIEKHFKLIGLIES